MAQRRSNASLMAGPLPLYHPSASRNNSLIRQIDFWRPTCEPKRWRDLNMTTATSDMIEVPQTTEERRALAIKRIKAKNDFKTHLLGVPRCQHDDCPGLGVHQRGTAISAGLLLADLRDRRLGNRSRDQWLRRLPRLRLHGSADPARDQAAAQLTGCEGRLHAGQPIWSPDA